MTKVVLVKYKIREGQKERWLKWCEELKRREAEVMETLENEGVTSEACFLSDDEQSVYYFMEAKSLERAHSPPRRFPVDEEHRIVRKSTLLPPETIKVLFNFHRTE